MRWLPAVVLLAACGQAAEPPRTAPSARALAAERKLQEGPTARTHAIRGGELLVIETPVKDIAGSVDGQRCFVWRDLEFRTSSISCGQEPDVFLGN